MASFTGGYGNDSNGWTALKRIADFTVSPQNSSHPDGDILYFSLATPYIEGITYSETAYIAEYEFNPSTDTAMIQDSSRLSNPT